MKRLMTYTELARSVGVEVSTLYGWVRMGRIPCVYLGPRCVRFDPEAVEAWLEKHHRCPVTSGTTPNHPEEDYHERG